MRRDIELKLSSDNPEAIRIYERQGFKFDKLIMKKEIKNRIIVFKRYKRLKFEYIIDKYKKLL